MAKMSVKVTVDQATADRARRYSVRHGISISKLVGNFLSRLPMEDDAALEVRGRSPHHYLLEKHSR
jgi:hypothetical protein